MAAQAQDIVINNLQGGMVDTDTPTAIPEDAVVFANNVEFFNAMLGERRNGCGPLDITSAGFGSLTVIAHLSQWFSSNAVTIPEFWAVGATAGSAAVISKRTLGTWSVVTPADAILTAAPDVYNIISQTGPSSLAPLGKLFWAYPSAQDRLHVWDPNNGPVLRRAGLAQPNPPTAADNGSGTFAATPRYYRIRYVREAGVGSQVTVRSEPSTAVTITPSGSGASVRVTRPALLGEGETHWEVEASFDNALFYNIQVLGTGTTFFDDVFTDITYATEGTLSEDIGEYLLLPSARYLAVDGDRLLLGGHFTDTNKQSSVWWTPVFNDPGVGNDERLPLSVDNTLSLDNYEGGPITGISNAVNGSWYVFKWSHIYKMTRTGDVTRAYDAITLSKTRGAIPGSIFTGMDENGAACIYFLDPKMGPSRIGAGGLQVIIGLRKTWARVNLRAENVIARGCYYPYKQQAHWWVAVDGLDRPGLKLVLQVSEMQRVGESAVGRGWSLATGRIAEAFAVAVFTEVVSINGIVSLSDRPFIGLTAPDFIQRCDTESTDAGVAYVATIRTRPYLVVGLLNRWGAMTAALLATANTTASVVVKFIRDFALETNQATAALAPTGSEELVIKTFDALAMSGARTIQVEFTDP